MNPAQQERHALADLLDEVGPDAPTCCEGWRARDLAAHLVIRDRRPDAAAGAVVPLLSGYTARVQNAVRDGRPWDDLVDRVRNGPPFPLSVPVIDTQINTVEFFIHHEDVRRATPGWTRRPVDPSTEAVIWRNLGLAGRLLVRRAPVGVRLEAPGRSPVVAKGGSPSVTVSGPPSEVLLWAFGRGDVAEVELSGDPDDVSRLKEAKLGF